MPRSARARTGDPLRYAYRAIGIATVVMLAACGSAAPAAEHGPAAPATSSTQTTPSPKPSATKPRPKPRVVISRFRAADGTIVTLAVFRGPVIFRLHGGSADPGSAALSGVRAGPSVGARERHRLLAAFNSGFLLSAALAVTSRKGMSSAPYGRV